MERRQLGTSNLQISNLSLGGMSIGPAASGHFMKGHTCTENPHELLDAAFELGINCIDSADVYGDDGASERIIGEWLQSRSLWDQIARRRSLATPVRLAKEPRLSGSFPV